MYTCYVKDLDPRPACMNSTGQSENEDGVDCDSQCLEGELCLCYIRA